MTRDQIMAYRIKAIDALTDPSEAVRVAADIVLRLWPEPKERQYEERLRND